MTGDQTTLQAVKIDTLTVERAACFMVSGRCVGFALLGIRFRRADHSTGWTKNGETGALPQLRVFDAE